MMAVLERTDNDTVVGCQRCARPTAGTLCVRCTVRLVELLKRTPALLRELGIVVARQDHLDVGGLPVYGRRSTEHAEDAALAHVRLVTPDEPTGVIVDALVEDVPKWMRARLRQPAGPALSSSSPASAIALPATAWPFAPDAAALLRETRSALASWVDHLRSTRGLHVVAPIGPTCLACHHLSCRRLRARRHRLDSRQVDVRLVIWLIRHRADLAQDDQAGRLVEHLHTLATRIEGVIDRRDPDVFLGLCGYVALSVDQSTCPAELYGHDGAQYAECRLCGTQFDVTIRKAALLRRVDDELRPVRDVADAVTGLLEDERHEPVLCTPSMVRSWQAAGRLAYRGTDRDGRQLVRVGDVVELLRVKLERDGDRRAKLASRPRRGRSA